jgi:DNA-binding GntR family transcriptional regulator
MTPRPLPDGDQSGSLEVSPEPGAAGNADRAANFLRRLLDSGERTDSLAIDIAVAVGREIIEGALGPGADLNSVDLSKRFDTSRTPVREALGLLERQGFVELSARRRPRVAELTEEQIESIYALRGELHGLVARRVALVADAEEIGQLEKLVAEMGDFAGRDDAAGYFWTSLEFQNLSSELTKDVTLTRTVNSLALRVLQLRYQSLSSPGRMNLSLEDHYRLLRAYRERDADLAAALTKSIVVSAFKGLRASSKWRNDPGSSRVSAPGVTLTATTESAGSES